MTPQGRAHGKCILIGEHSVVHGTPAIAIPVSLGLQVRLERFEKDQKPKVKLPRKFISWFRAVSEQHCEQSYLPMSIAGDLPTGAGLGSSAALGVAALRALAQIKELSDEQLLVLANQSESLFHGNPSGVDVQTVLSDEPVLFRRLESGTVIDKLNVDRSNFHFQLWITPKGDSTADVVSRVGQSLENNKVTELQKASKLIKAAENALTKGCPEQLGPQLNLFHQWLARHGASTPLLDELVNLAISSGAHGAKLTGGGGGGAMLVLKPDIAWTPPDLPDTIVVLDI